MTRKTLVIVLFLFLSNFPLFAFEPIYSKNGMVVGPEPHAVRAGVEILQQGGNAFDSAVAVGFALAVTLPWAGNLGGGGFLTAHTAEGESLFLDFREVAPQDATREMFLDDNGEVIPDLSTDSLLAVGVPGTVEGLFRILKDHGTLSLEAVLQPAIQLAEEGFPLGFSESHRLKENQERLMRFSSTARIFFPQGEALAFGDTLQQSDLANTLRILSQQGREAFYRGEIAQRIVKYMQVNGGLITEEDLRSYESKYREPIRFTFKQYSLITPGLPSSGGITLAQILKLIEPFDLKSMGLQSADYIHALVEAERLAFADRNYFLGDPEFVDAPVDKLMSEEYLNQRRQRIPKDGAGNRRDVMHGDIPFKPSRESSQTTHYSVVDKEGNAVAVTYTLNGAYGMGAVVEGAGFLLNNEMDDFSAKPGSANQFGLVQGEANDIQPGKRMLSSMAPTIVLKDNRFAFTFGTPGGPTIITTNLQVFLNMAEFGMNIRDAIDSRRFHHQWLPDEILREPFAFSPDTETILIEKGYKVESTAAIGSAAGIQAREDGLLAGYADGRGEGLALGY